MFNRFRAIYKGVRTAYRHASSPGGHFVNRAFYSLGYGLRRGLLNDSQPLQDLTMWDLYRLSPLFKKGIDLVAQSVANVEWGVQQGPDGEIIPLKDTMTDLSTLTRWYEFERPRKAEKLAVVYYLLLGEITIGINRGRGKMPMLQLFPPTWVTRKKDMFEVEAPLGKKATYRLENFIYIKDSDPENPYGRGYAIGTGMREDTQSDIAGQRSLTRYFRNNGMPPFIVSKKQPAGNVLIQARASSFKEQWKQDYQGVEQAGEPAVLEDEVSVHEFRNLYNLGDLDKIRMQLSDRARMYLGIPPELFGDVKNSNRATIRTAEYLLQKYCVLPIKETLQEAFDEKLGDGSSMLVVVNPVPEDLELKIDIMKSAPEGTFTMNEWRAAAGFDELGDMV